MHREPSQFDFHAAAALSGFLGRHPLFDYCVQSAMVHHLLGGIPFAAVFFYLWVRAEQEKRSERLCRLVTILLGSFVAIALALLAAKVIFWLPPRRQPELEHLYPGYLLPDPNTNSFPSDSTSVFSSMAFGYFSVNRLLGVILLVAVLAIVSLPRMYVGGHYPTDILAGLLIGLVSYGVARAAFEGHLSSRIAALGNRTGLRRAALETCVYLWILEVSVNFREGVWILNTLRYFHVRFLP